MTSDLRRTRGTHNLLKVTTKYFVHPEKYMLGKLTDQSIQENKTHRRLGQMEK